MTLPTVARPVLLREALGDVLRTLRVERHLTLREVSSRAVVSLGYLSELERGHKEASSELLLSICDALDVRLADVLVLTAQRVTPVTTITPLHVDVHAAA